MTQSGLDWDGARELPISGSTRSARHASATGAAVAVKHYGRKVIAYAELLAALGQHGLNDHAAVDLMRAKGIRLAGVMSICSIRNGLDSLIEHTGEYDATEFGSRRGRYRLSAEGRSWMANWRARR